MYVICENVKLSGQSGKQGKKHPQCKNTHTHSTYNMYKHNVCVCICPKVMEKGLFARLARQLSQNKQITLFQQGYNKGSDPQSIYLRIDGKYNISKHDGKKLWTFCRPVKITVRQINPNVQKICRKIKYIFSEYSQ